jgi:hypothetical protein
MFNTQLAEQLRKVAPDLKLKAPAESKPRCVCHNKWLKECPAQQPEQVRQPKTIRVK